MRFRLFRVPVRFRFVGGHFCLVQLSCRRCGKLRSFLSSAIAPDTFLREVPLAVVVSSSAWCCRRVYIWCEFLAVRATPSKMLVRLTRVEHESPHLRLHSSWPKREGSRSAVSDRIEQRWLNLGFGNVSLFVCFLSLSRLRRPSSVGAHPGEANGSGG